VKTSSRSSRTSWKALPKTALAAISKRQRSYIDEFDFHLLKNGDIEAFYGGEYIGYWDSERERWLRGE
jgi:hypothetical protein